mmetsp:Transcript_61900/g.110276  ORF Transcript_61900/g.110276 Transcript_61900/m.110276 type:complete len:230 (+) Transcript_61900:473-1162(+)
MKMSVYRHCPISATQLSKAKVLMLMLKTISRPSKSLGSSTKGSSSSSSSQGPSLPLSSQGLISIWILPWTWPKGVRTLVFASSSIMFASDCSHTSASPTSCSSMSMNGSSDSGHAVISWLAPISMPCHSCHILTICTSLALNFSHGHSSSIPPSIVTNTATSSSWVKRFLYSFGMKPMFLSTSLAIIFAWCTFCRHSASRWLNTCVRPWPASSASVSAMLSMISVCAKK